MDDEKVEVEGKGGFNVNYQKLFQDFAQGQFRYLNKFSLIYLLVTGEQGTYPTLEEAYKLKLLLKAILTSAQEGRTITL